MKPEELKPIAKHHAKNMQFIMQELKNLNDRLINTDISKEGDKFMTNMVEATFLMTGFTLAQKSFATLITSEPDETKKPLDYFNESVNKMLTDSVVEELHNKEDN